MKVCGSVLNIVMISNIFQMYLRFYEGIAMYLEGILMYTKK